MKRLQPLEARRIGFAADRHQQPHQQPEADGLGFAEERTAGDPRDRQVVDRDTGRR